MLAAAVFVLQHFHYPHELASWPKPSHWFGRRPARWPARPETLAEVIRGLLEDKFVLPCTLDRDCGCGQAGRDNFPSGIQYMRHGGQSSQSHMGQDIWHKHSTSKNWSHPLLHLMSHLSSAWHASSAEQPDRQSTCHELYPRHPIWVATCHGPPFGGYWVHVDCLPYIIAWNVIQQASTDEHLPEM